MKTARDWETAYAIPLIGIKTNNYRPSYRGNAGPGFPTADRAVVNLAFAATGGKTIIIGGMGRSDIYYRDETFTISIANRDSYWTNGK